MKQKNKAVYFVSILLNVCTILGIFFNVFSKNIEAMNANGQIINTRLYVNFFDYSIGMGKTLWAFLLLVPIFILLLSTVCLIALLITKKQWQYDKKLLLIQIFAITILCLIALFTSSYIYLIICFFVVILQTALLVILEKDNQK